MVDEEGNQGIVQDLGYHGSGRSLTAEASVPESLQSRASQAHFLSRLGLDRQAGLARWFHSDLDIDSR